MEVYQAVGGNFKGECQVGEETSIGCVRLLDGTSMGVLGSWREHLLGLSGRGWDYYGEYLVGGGISLGSVR